eukprot:TRINITY_DN6341_c0_g1_i2.p1 TRINITY_DN6341_c0_g1~~TRINITY_DN6341_c0_g1_i2.p1  ORF type:complete len:258 (+),score=38.41 TRINITY_DN6341_c0_g1_i2:102-875(+)
MAASIRVRSSDDRGHANHGWLNSYHSFNFASYQDGPDSYGPLRVINEDRVAGGEGFGMHPHANFEIFSYILTGQLEHKDSLGNREVLEAGDVQFTSAGSGISHSEYNHSPDKPVYFLQMWIKPDQRGLNPNYQTRNFKIEDRKGKLCKIISPKVLHDADTISINQDAHVYVSVLDKGDPIISHKFSENRRGYLHLAMHDRKGSLVLSSPDLEGGHADILLKGGDGVYIENVSSFSIQSVGNEPAEFVLFDLPASASA